MRFVQTAVECWVHGFLKVVFVVNFVLCSLNSCLNISNVKKQLSFVQHFSVNKCVQ
jgi:hypothetical protein